MNTTIVKTITLLLFAFSTLKCISQQHFKFKYVIKDGFIGQRGELYEKSASGTEIKYLNKKIFTTVKLSEGKDTLFLMPWYANSGNNILRNQTNVNSDLNNSNNYFIRVTNWSTNLNKNPYVDLRFRLQQFTATNLPFRVNLNNGDLQGDFLNANVTYLWIWGKTRIYKSKFVESRDYSFGIGPFLGASTIKDNDKSVFGLNYGLNTVYTLYNLNLILAFGAETGFNSSVNSFTPYIGLGAGFKLVDINTHVKN